MHSDFDTGITLKSSTMSSHMNRTVLFAAGLLLAACSADTETDAPIESAAPADPAVSAIVDAAINTLGVDDMNTVTFAGTAWRVRNGFRQTYEASPPWPWRDEITNYQRTIDLNTLASRATGETFAQNMFLQPPAAGTYSQNIAAGADSWSQQLEVWTTPWGFLKGAEMYGTTEGPSTLGSLDVTAVTWQSPEDVTSPSGLRYSVTGYIDEFNLVRRVETRVEDAFMGDMLVAGVYEDYKPLGDIMVPATMQQERGGGGIFGLRLDTLEINPANAAALLEIPAGGGPGGFPGGGGGGAGQPALGEMSEEVMDGVYVITGGYQSLAVEFNDYVAVFEAGQNEALGERVLAEVKHLFPGKQIRYLINSHPHSDHTGGIVPFVREGAAILTHERNIDFMEMALSTPRTLLGEETMSPRFRPASGVTVLEDDTRRLELHHIPNLHNDGTIVAVIPGPDGLLFQADFTLPQPGAEANPFVLDLANYVDQNDIQFDQYIAVHAAAEPQSRADLMATIGK